MRRLLSGAMLLTVGMFSMFNPDDSCDGEQTIFDAYTVKGGKHVGVCYVYGNVRYVYGKDSAKPEILLDVSAEKVDFSMAGNGDQSLTIPNGDYNYIVGDYLRGGHLFRYGKGRSLLLKLS
ncbi:MAG: hypothetical protein ACLR17_18395 [Enterobacteriaceae bacterium]